MLLPRLFRFRRSRLSKVCSEQHCFVHVVLEMQQNLSTLPSGENPRTRSPRRLKWLAKLSSCETPLIPSAIWDEKSGCGVSNLFFRLRAINTRYSASRLPHVPGLVSRLRSMLSRRRDVKRYFLRPILGRRRAAPPSHAEPGPIRQPGIGTFPRTYAETTRL